MSLQKIMKIENARNENSNVFFLLLQVDNEPIDAATITTFSPKTLLLLGIATALISFAIDLG